MNAHPLLQKSTVLIILILGIVIYVATINDAPLYHQPIARVMTAQSGPSRRQKDEFNNQENTHNQTLRLKILNGSAVGKTVTAKNTFSDSNAQDLEYHRGQQLLIHLQHSGKHYRIQIIDLKRDTVVALTILIMVGCLVIVLGKFGIRPLLSLLLNMALFFIAIKVDIFSDAEATVLLFVGVAVAFLVVTTTVLFGITRKTGVIISSAALGLIAAFLIEILVLQITNGRGLKFEMMNFVTQSRMPLYISASLLGVLGAVVDIAGDVTVSLFASHHSNQNLSRLALFQAGYRLNRSVVGPLSNVLFLIFITSTMPMMILFLRNGNSVGYSVTMMMSLGIFQTLASAVGISLTGPITSLIASYILKKGA